VNQSSGAMRLKSLSIRVGGLIAMLSRVTDAVTRILTPGFATVSTRAEDPCITLSRQLPHRPPAILYLTELKITTNILMYYNQTFEKHVSKIKITKRDIVLLKYEEREISKSK
jgi:hypothetical protein